MACRQKAEQDNPPHVVLGIAHMLTLRSLADLLQFEHIRRDCTPPLDYHVETSNLLHKVFKHVIAGCRHQVYAAAHALKLPIYLCLHP